MFIINQEQDKVHVKICHVYGNFWQSNNKLNYHLEIPRVARGCEIIHRVNHHAYGNFDDVRAISTHFVRAISTQMQDN